MSKPQTCPCGSDTFQVIAALPIPVLVGPSGVTVQIDTLLGNITRVDARCAQCGRTTDETVPSPLQNACGTALTALAHARLTIAHHAIPRPYTPPGR
jgi:hypothetical protein